MKQNLLNISGDVVGEIDLIDSIFSIEPNEHVVHAAVVAYLANQRQGTQSAKTRGEVSGGGRKPWRQKGTGRARVGSSRNPIWRHGGVAFAPKPRDYSMKINKKVKRLALKSVLASKVLTNELIVLDELSFDTPQTKAMIKILDNLHVKKGLVVTADNDQNVLKSVSNIDGSRCMHVGMINVYELLLYDHLILTRESLERISEVFA